MAGVTTIPSYLAIGQLFLLPSAPMDHSTQLWGYVGNRPVQYSEERTGVECDLPASQLVSECVHVIKPSDKLNGVPITAKAVLVQLKAKAWPKNNSYCQIDAQLQGEGVAVGANLHTLDQYFANKDHAIHTEEWAKPIERRRIEYTSYVVPLASDGTFAISIRKGIFNDSLPGGTTGICEVSIAITLQGYYL